MSDSIVETSTITCPHCEHHETLTMPTDACRAFYTCPQCTRELTPKEGDCCVFCSFGDVECPPIQRGESCCAEPE